MDTSTTRLRISDFSPTLIKWMVVTGLLGVATIVAIVFRNQWLPRAEGFLATASTGKAEKSAGRDGHAGHNHGHKGHDEGNSLELSPQARKNIGLRTAVVKLGPYERSVSMPAMVIGRPGRAQIEVTAPLGGRVTRVYPIEGEAVEPSRLEGGVVKPGQPLFDLRLTHEELVKSQSELLRSVGQLDVEIREIKRLRALVESKTIAGKRLLERQYEKQKIDAVINAQRQSLLLHGLTKQQIDGIVQKQILVQDVTVFAPQFPKNGYDYAPGHPFTVRTLHVKPGQYVEAGALLCSLMDYGELYLQGRAFEHDGDELLQAAREGRRLIATRESNGQVSETIKGLKIVYVDNEVNPESRALYFYAGLPNKIAHESRSSDGHRFVTWRYKPGQRMQLSVPVEQWSQRIVLPVDAVAKEGVEFYVFQQNGHHFDRVPVQVEYRDQLWTVIANDGSILPGATVAISGAHQLQMALKNKAGGGVDPHAGHNH